MIETRKIFVAKRRLSEWAHWCYQIVTMGLDYSSRSLITEPPNATPIATRARSLAPRNSSAEEINELLEELGEIKPKWVDAIKIFYTIPEKDHLNKIKALKLSRRSYQRHLVSGEHWIANHLFPD